MARSALYLVILLGVGSINFSANAFDYVAPFGLSWGPVENVPRPSLATREDNVTLLMYHQDRLPTGAKDTEEIVLEVCKGEGLQHVIWISRFFSDAEEKVTLQTIIAEGTRRYGKVEISERGVLNWPAGHTMAASVPIGDLYRIVMSSAGPGFDSCSKQHKSITGHPLDDHWMRFMPGH